MFRDGPPPPPSPFPSGRGENKGGMLNKAFFLMLSVEGLSLLAFVYSGLSLPLLILAGVLTLWLSLKNLQYGIYILFGELFVGSRGRLLEEGFISLRMVVFGAVFVAWLVAGIMKHELGIRKIKTIIHNSKFLILYMFLIAVMILAAFHGYINGHGLKNVFLDANSYLYLLILPAVLAGIRSREAVENIFKILAAAILIIAAKTLILFIWFTYGFAGAATLYHWIIEREIGEITGVVGSASRIFMQSQFWAVVGVFVFLPPLNLPLFRPRSEQGEKGKAGLSPFVREGENKRGFAWFIVSAALLSVILSLSRSFWLGAVAGAFFFAGISIFKLRLSLAKLASLGGIIILMVALETGGLYLLSRGASGAVSESVASRIGNPATEAAGYARLLQLPELFQEIKEAPLLGSGFGTVVTYSSFLPERVTKSNPEGKITSYAFEWGYLDIWLKIGLVGLIIYLLFIARIFRLGMQSVKGKMQNLGILSGLVALLILNITTPYLNHPLGIGYLLLALLSFRNLEEGLPS